jgi:hypothetical protein
LIVGVKKILSARTERLRAMAKIDLGQHERLSQSHRKRRGNIPIQPLACRICGALLPHDAMTHYNFGLALGCAER